MANSAAVASDQDEEDFAGLSLDGLAGLWNGDETIRSIVLHSGSLLQWPDPKKRGSSTSQLWPRMPLFWSISFGFGVHKSPNPEPSRLIMPENRRGGY